MSTKKLEPACPKCSAPLCEHWTRCGVCKHLRGADDLVGVTFDVKLALKLSAHVHNKCKDAPHDIGIHLASIVSTHQASPSPYDLPDGTPITYVVTWPRGEPKSEVRTGIIDGRDGSYHAPEKSLARPDSYFANGKYLVRCTSRNDRVDSVHPSQITKIRDREIKA